MVTKVVTGISLAINLVAMAYSPEVIILYGSLVYKFPILRKLLKDHYLSYIHEYAKGNFSLRFSRYDHLGHLVGGAIQATAVVLCAVVAFTVTWWALASLREDLGWVPLIGWAAFVGSCVFAHRLMVRV